MITIFLFLGAGMTSEAVRVLVFTKSVRSPHASRADGVALVERLAVRHGFEVDASAEATDFTDANLFQYDAVIFMNTGGDVLNGAQEGSLRRFIQRGGGWVGVHAAAVTETGWVWYQGLIGAIFDSHPAQQEATIVVEDRSHPSTSHLGETWTRWDEWYNYRSNPRPEVNVLLTLDESSYSGGTMGADHPIAWYHEYDGGRSWYTGLGHTSLSYREPEFEQHLLGGILYAAGVAVLDPLLRTETILPAGAEWRFWDRGDDPGAAWVQPEFDDGAWASGPAKFGFGDGTHVTALDSGPPADRTRTFYFRRRFEWDDSRILESLTARLLRDDGAVVYLNGAEIGRSNLGEGLVDRGTYATESIESSLDLFCDFDLTAFRDLLRPGTNVLAVEVHQAETGLSDLGFDLTLVAEMVRPPTPMITRTAAGRIEVSWPEGYTTSYGARLEASASLVSWTPVEGAPEFRNGRAVHSLPLGDRCFFRLRYGLPVP